MKRFLVVALAVMALFVAIPHTALASAYQPNYTELIALEGNMSFLEARWGQDGYSKANYPYQIYLNYKFETLSNTISIISAQPIVFNSNTLQFESDSGLYIRKFVLGSVATTENLSSFVLLDSFNDVRVYSSHDIMMKGEDRTFFPLPPLPTPTPTLEEITGAALTKNSPMSQVIFLLPLLISLVVSFLTLRKALEVLRTTLSKG